MINFLLYYSFFEKKNPSSEKFQAYWKFKNNLGSTQNDDIVKHCT